MPSRHFTARFGPSPEDNGNAPNQLSIELAFQLEDICTSVVFGFGYFLFCFVFSLVLVCETG